MTEIVPLIADLHTVRCGGCKVLVDDPLIVKCSICGATFDRVVSNHVGLANRLNSERSGAGDDDGETETGEATATEELVAVPRGLLTDLAGALAEIDGAGQVAAATSKLAESAPAVDAGDNAGAAGEAAAAARKAGSLD
ncbi:MAG TPA: hypothetical protein DCE47_17520 [Planctomycetaceae bacterium]|nr:hypothetical protein [Planctomycetaceae bacterium]HCD02008.1 hypothetical protein [Planctomycetaceae bacterium]|tara:strand:+ start:6792 stop:7208 length:417 start_codon:yes stop_codon:yes gene_type:complete